MPDTGPDAPPDVTIGKPVPGDDPGGLSTAVVVERLAYLVVTGRPADVGSGGGHGRPGGAATGGAVQYEMLVRADADPAAVGSLAPVGQTRVRMGARPPGYVSSPGSTRPARPARPAVNDVPTPQRTTAMPTISSQLDVDRSVAEVWDVWSDVRRLPELSPSTDAVEDAPVRLTEVGQTFHQLAHVPGRALDVTWTVTAVADQEGLVIEATPVRGVHLTITEQVEPLRDRGTRLTLTIGYHLPFGPLGRAVNRLGLERRAAAEAAQVVEGVARLVTARTAR